MRWVTAWVFTGLALVPAPAVSAVRVDQDEVIFSIRAPEATEVFLVGDFNQWNPTVEPMNRVGDRFEVGLFLVAGTYRYKFVVDGKEIADPDNPGRAPERGSPLRLVERSGGLILSTELPEEEGPAGRAAFGARYIGRFTEEDGETDVVHRVDGFVSATLDRLRARAAVASHDSLWSGSPLAVEAFFERGLVEVGLGRLSVRGFENDSTWASSDPTGLVGRAGVYRYDAGFRRHGVSAVAASSKAALRAVYAGETSRRPGAVAALPGLAGYSGGADTTAYATTPTFAGADLAAIEMSLRMGEAGAGYARRDERGVNPGMVARVTPSGAGYVTELYAARENRTASSLWLSYDVTRRLRATAAYGWGGTEARAYAVERTIGPAAQPQFTGAGEAVDAAFTVGATDRSVVSLETIGEGAAAALRWDYTRFDFEGVGGDSRAEVHRATVRGSTSRGRWGLFGSAEYTHARYNDAPDALHVDWPEQNVWLSLWDTFDPARLAAANRDAYTVFRLGAARADGRIEAAADLAYAAEDVAGSFVHASARGRVEWAIRGPWRAELDTRLAWYDEEDDGGRAYESFHAEAGYRSRRWEVDAGFGFDPRIFDPVISDYADIGREEALRGALAGGFARSRADAITAGLRTREQALADARVFKVEFIVHLP